MAGKLYGVGIGPGDPELITIKARRIMGEADVIAVPKTADEKASVALEIALEATEQKKEILELLFPMSRDKELLAKSWESASAQIRERLDDGRDVAFITLGDPTIYSTYMYIHKKLLSDGYHAEVIPGVTSFCAAAAKAGISLGENNEAIAIIPSAYECKNMENIINDFNSIVLMKVWKDLDSMAAKLEGEGLLDKSVLISNCGMENEIVEYDWRSLRSEKISYFSTVIIKKNGVK